MGSFSKIGNWSMMAQIVSKLDSEYKAAEKEALMKVGLKMEGLAKKHISKQDLGWKRLSPSTIASKVRKNQSEKTLVATSTYFQSITSFVKDNVAYAGVRRVAKTKNGTALHNVARTHEYGRNKRPLWKPTMIETVQWIKDKKVFENTLRNNSSIFS